MVREKCGKCDRKMKTNLKHKIVSKTDHSCIPKLAGMEFKVKLENYTKKKKKKKKKERKEEKKRIQYDVSVPVHTIVRHLIYEFPLATHQSQLTQEKQVSILSTHSSHLLHIHH